jgi:protoporphyrinogen/coproporphyrinogen III oxidase
MKSVRVQRPKGSILFETGPHSIRTAPVPGLAPLELLDDLNISKEAVFLYSDSPLARARYVKYKGRLQQLGLSTGRWGWLSAFTDELMRAQVLGFLKFVLLRPWGPAGKEDESIGDFMRRMTTRKCADIVPSAVVHGVYAGDFDRLSMRSTMFKVLWKMYVNRELTFRPPLENGEWGQEIQSDFSETLNQAAEGSLSFTFPDGTETLAIRLLENLRQQRQVTIKTDSPVHSIAFKNDEFKIRSTLQSGIYSHVISTMPLAKLFPLLPHFPPELGASFPPAVTVGVVNLYYPPESFTMPIQGFGYLIPKTEVNPEDALGVLFASNFAGSQDQGRYAQGTKLTVMMGGHYWRDRRSYPSDDDLLVAAKAVVARDLGITIEPEVTLVNLQRDCIPQYEVGHWRRVEKLKEYLDWTFGKDRVFVVGAGVDGVGIGDCVLYARKAALQIQELCLKGLGKTLGDI